MPGKIILTIRSSLRVQRKIFLNCIGAAQENGVIPELYQACGTKDFLYEMNLDAKRRLEKMGAKLTWSETEGAMHNWDYWDKEIQKILDWMMNKTCI